jgi:hypothetical protein
LSRYEMRRLVAKSSFGSRVADMPGLRACATLGCRLRAHREEQVACGCGSETGTPGGATLRRSGIMLKEIEIAPREH